MIKLICISDTHGKHRRLRLPPGDVLIHAGDCTFEGADHQAEDFLSWLGKLPYRHKLFIAGNHDFYFEGMSEQELLKIIPAGVTYLHDSGTIIDGIKVWGSPVTPWFFDWAFNKKRGADIAKTWKQIPADTKLLITHGPPANILDTTEGGFHAGCKILRKRVQQIQPRVHVFGHIHEGYGMIKHGTTTFINASMVNANFQLVHSPVVLEW